MRWPPASRRSVRFMFARSTTRRWRTSSRSASRRANDLQLPRPAHQPGRGDRAPARGLRPRLPGDHRRRPRPARLRQGTGRERRRWDRRAQRRLRTQGDRGRRGRTEEWFVDATELGLGPAPLDAIQEGSPPRTRRSSARCSRVSRARRATSRSSTPGAIYVAGAAGELQEGVAKAREAIDSGAARDVLGRLVARSKELSGAS